MSTGARSTDQWREHRALLEAIQRGTSAAEPAPPVPRAGEADAEAEPAPAPLAQRIAAIALVVLGLLWLAAFVTSFQPEAAPVAEIAARISLASAPLALLGIAYLLLQRTSRREAHRFGRTAAAMRGEAAALEATIARLGERIDDSRKAVAEHASELLALGEDSALRLAELGATMQAETVALTRNAERLEAAAATAFSDMGTMVADLPGIEAQVHALAATLRETGREANEQTATLSTELVALASRAREVDEVAGGAAQRLSAHLARIESISDAAGSRIDAAAAGIARTVDTALTSAAEAVDATRAGIDAQSAALLAMIDEGKVAFALAGADAAASLGGRIATTIAQADDLGERLGRHDEAARALLAMLTERIGAVDTALAEADANGTARAGRLAELLRAVGDEASAVGDRIERNGVATDALVARGERLQAVVEACAGDLGERLPELLAAIEDGAARGGAAIGALGSRANALAVGVSEAEDALRRIDPLLARQRDALDGIGTAAGDQLAGLGDQARALDTLLGDTAERARAVSAGAAPQLVEALLRVRETATQAADHAGRAFAEVIQRAAARLGEESRDALDEQLGDAVEARLAAIAAASDRAVGAAQAASTRLTEQMTAIAATSEAIEARLAEAREAELANREDAVSSRVARLIEELNSIGIDVTKLLATETPDTLWAGYLKGDRGIFTRRAARLVDAAEAREIARRYEEEPPFRDHVNRYIHDFEAMLRHILAIRDGSLLGVTLLSSDMGKLYVALAQAIERLRT